MMDTIAQYLTQSTLIAALILFSITFLESIAVVGLLIPSAVIMTAIGVLIAQDYLNFYLAWSMAFLGCFLGDGLSFFLGVKFNQKIMRWSWLKKQEKIIQKTERSLVENRFTTIIIGRYVGILRPLVPLLSGLLNLSFKKYCIPSLIACITWPILYLMPGIIAGAATEFPEESEPRGFQILLASIIILIWASYYYASKIRNFRKKNTDGIINGASLILFNRPAAIYTIFGFMLIFLSILFYYIIQNPLLDVYLTILKKIFISSLH
ncbi:DedA family protein [Thorsellia kenyensis]|uniref:DedA family protein n=1 Tax=Thorsellia kenyensis TaxID=1549888 RepID=A0ABV6CBQ2_9GAMM